jgi:hypothetical protein
MRTFQVIWLGTLVFVLGPGRSSLFAQDKKPTDESALKNNPTHESVLKEIINIMKSATTGLASIRDTKTAKATSGQLKEYASRIRNLTQETEKLGKPTANQKKQIRKHMQDLIDSANNLKQERQALPGKATKASLPANVQKALGSALNDFGLALLDFGRMAEKLHF